MAGADNIQQDTSQFTKIYTLSIPAGIKRDGTIFETSEYNDGVWCRFQRGVPKKMGGYKQLFASQIGIYRGMIIQPYNGVNYVFTGNYESLDVFTTGLSLAVGSGPYQTLTPKGSVFADVTANTTTTLTIKGDATTAFPVGSKIIFTQAGTPTEYTVQTISYTSPNTTLTFTPALGVGVTVTRFWNTDTTFTADVPGGPYRNLWQFDAQFSPSGGELQVFAHPGKNLANIDNGVVSQVLVGNITPDSSHQWTFTGLCDSQGQNPTFKPIEVDGGVTVLYPFIFVYGSNGFIANNNVDNTYPDRGFYDWNGPLANQTNVASSKIVKGMPMRGGTNAPSGLFWATDSLIRVSFNSQATSNYWSYDIISSQISIMSSSSVVEMDGVYYWLGIDRFYAYNGTVTLLPNDKNVNWLFDNLNYDQRQKVWATKVPRYNEIWFFYPRGTATECTDAIIYNVKDKIWYDAGSATGAQRSCGYPTELLPTPIWADWNYNPEYSDPIFSITPPASISPIADNQAVFEGDQTILFTPGSGIAFEKTNNPDDVYPVLTSEFIYDGSIPLPGVTLVTFGRYLGAAQPVNTAWYSVINGFALWQHEIGTDQVTFNRTLAIYSSITTSDISWISGSPGGENLVGLNRRMHLRRVEPNFLQSGDMSMTVLGRKFANGQANVENSQPFYFTPQSGKIDMRIEYRLVRLQFVSNTVGGNYEMGRLVITAEYGDERP